MSPLVDATIKIEAAFEVFEGRGLKPHLLHLGAGPMRGVVAVNPSEFTSVNYLTVFVKAKVCVSCTVHNHVFIPGHYSYILCQTSAHNICLRTRKSGS